MFSKIQDFMIIEVSTNKLSKTQCGDWWSKIKNRRQPTMHELKELVHHSLQKLPMCPRKKIQWQLIRNKWRQGINDHWVKRFSSQEIPNKIQIRNLLMWYLKNLGYCPTMYMMFEAMIALLSFPRLISHKPRRSCRAEQ